MEELSELPELLEQGTDRQLRHTYTAYPAILTDTEDVNGHRRGVVHDAHDEERSADNVPILTPFAGDGYGESHALDPPTKGILLCSNIPVSDSLETSEFTEGISKRRHHEFEDGYFVPGVWHDDEEGLHAELGEYLYRHPSGVEKRITTGGDVITQQAEGHELSMSSESVDIQFAEDTGGQLAAQATGPKWSFQRNGTAIGPAVETKKTNNRIEIAPGDDIQGRIDQAGTNAIIVFEQGSYPVAGLRPQNGQTWIAGQGVEFRPDGDVTALDFNGVEDFVAPNTIHVTDTSEASQKSLIYFEATRRCYFARITVTNAYNGIRMAGYASNDDDIRECIFDSIYMREIRNDGMSIIEEPHDNHFNTIWIKGLPGSAHGIRWNTDGTEDGGNMISQMTCISMGGDGFHLEGIDRELWIGQAILDSCGAHGFNCYADGNRALFINSAWASGNTETGMRLSGDTESVNDVQLSQLYTIGNGLQGLVAENVDGLQIGRITARDNNTGVEFGTATSTNAFIGHIETSANTDQGIIGSQAGENCRIGSYYAPDGTSGIANFETLEDAWA